MALLSIFVSFMISSLLVSAHASNSASASADYSQVLKTMEAYAPLVYFHPHEKFFPSQVPWFFQNGAELHRTGQPPEHVINDGDNLPNTGRPDDAFLDLPSKKAEIVKKGFLSEAISYVHVKPALAGTCTDLAIWLFYPFNGGAKFQVGPFVINLGRIGAHLGDWEHITLRIDNVSGVLKAIYLSQHAKGKWYSPDQFEVVDGTRPVVYAALHGHANYPTPRSHLHKAGNLDPSDLQILYEEAGIMNTSTKAKIVENKIFGFGVRDDAAKSDKAMDLSTAFDFYIDDFDDHMPPWLNYTGRWGPKKTYDFVKEVKKITEIFPDKVKDIIIKALNKLPDELLGQEGPQGPKMKESWLGDERV